MDKIDQNILKVLQDNGRITIAELAEKIGMSRTPTFERVRKLEKNGTIDRYVAVVNPQKIGITCFTYVEVQLVRHGTVAVERFLNSIMKISEVMECHHITGEADFLLKVATRDIPAYEELVLHTLTALENVQNLKTLVVLSTMKQESHYPIR